MNLPEPNPHLQRLDQLQSARQKYKESEWYLSFLRTETDQSPKPLTEAELLEWNKRLH